MVLNPTLVASRNIQLEPPYKGGPELADNAVIPIERTQVPVEWDDLRDSISTDHRPRSARHKEQPKGPFGDVIESLADGLAGKGEQINNAEQPVDRAEHAERRPRRLLRGAAQPGDVRQRADIRTTSSSSR